MTAIESLGNYVSTTILQNKSLGENKQPGMLCNMKAHDGIDFQEPHWDFVGWREIKAKDMPWVVHVPLCKEGMMVHVWPMERDERSHASRTLEAFQTERPTVGSCCII